MTDRAARATPAPSGLDALLIEMGLPLIGLIALASVAIPTYFALRWYQQINASLVHASERGDARAVSWLLRLGARPDPPRPMADTALAAAARAGSEPTARTLLAHGANPNLVLSDEWTPLMVAAERGSLPVVQLLLEHGADPTVHTRQGTALTRAAAAGHLEIVQTLIARGNARAQDVDGALSRAAALYRHPDTMMELLLASEVSQAGKTAALATASTPQRVLTLLDAGAQLNGGDYPAVVTAAFAKPEVLRLLLARGADVEARDVRGRTALFAATWPPSIRQLLDAGANLEARDANGDTPMLAAMRGREIDKARLLIEQGADVNAVDRSGRTALMLETESCNLALVRLLLSRGAAAGATTPDGRTAAQLAADRKRERHLWCGQWDELVAVLGAPGG